MIYLKRLLFKLLRKTPADMPMVQYWKRVEAVEAKVTKDASGATVMKMAGEEQIIPGYPRGYLLFGKLSKLKHEIKNQIFNDAWAKFEAEIPVADILAEIRGPILDRIFALAEETKYDQLPPERMNVAVRELHRAWTAADASERSCKLRDIVCFIFQEDDSYRFRFQWLVTYLKPWPWSNPLTHWQGALEMLEHAEVIGDMKERIRLLRRTLLPWTDNDAFKNFMKHAHWKKIQLTAADKFHFRGKYFKVDLDKFEY